MAVFEKTEFEKQVEGLFLKTLAPGKNCARNAFRHIASAFDLAERAPEMAAFQAITAEEEAATAVFHAIRRWNTGAGSSWIREITDRRMLFTRFFMRSNSC